MKHSATLLTQKQEPGATTSPETTSGEEKQAPAKTIKEKIWDMGKEMCEGAKDNPLCKRFLKDEPTTTTTTVPTTSTTNTTTTTTTVTSTTTTTTTNTTTTTTTTTATTTTRTT